jgi:hypothetical protein
LAVVWRRISATASASAGLSTAIRTTSAPAAASAFTCAAVASMSRVGVAVMLCTAIGWPAPIVTVPMRTDRVGLRGMF